MARDRMVEFLLFAPYPRCRSATSGDAGGGECSVSLMPVNDETEPFFAALQDIQHKASTLEALHVTQLVKNRTETRELIHDVVGKIRDLCQKCRGIIDKYGCMTLQLVRDSNKGGALCLNGASLRMRQNIMSFMEYRLLMMVRTIWTLQRTHEERLVDATARRLSLRIALANGDCSDGEGSAVNEARTKEIAQRLVASRGDDRLFLLSCHELERVLYTRDAILELEQEMQDLLGLFTDLHFLVKEQHERLVIVQRNVGTSTYTLEAGLRHLKDAKHHQKSCCTVL